MDGKVHWVLATSYNVQMSDPKCDFFMLKGEFAGRFWSQVNLVHGNKRPVFACRQSWWNSNLVVMECLSCVHAGLVEREQSRLLQQLGNLDSQQMPCTVVDRFAHCSFRSCQGRHCRGLGCGGVGRWTGLVWWGLARHGLVMCHLVSLCGKIP